jgi:hypothetical protein
MPGKYRSARPLVQGSSNEPTAVNLRLARKRWRAALRPQSVQSLKTYSQEFGFSIVAGDLILLDNGWYVTHTGLIRLAQRKHCAGIDVNPVAEFSLTTASRWAFRATVYKSRNCRGFVGYGDADPSCVLAGCKPTEQNGTSVCMGFIQWSTLPSATSPCRRDDPLSILKLKASFEQQFNLLT